MGENALDTVRLFVLSPAGTADKDSNQCKAPHPVVFYIIEEMKKNAQSEEIEAVRRLLESDLAGKEIERMRDLTWIRQFFISGTLGDLRRADIANKLAGNAKFACLVADARTNPVCGEWDHKPKIRGQWGVSQEIDFQVLGKNESITFYYDIWSNIHFGFVGMAAGFNESYLLGAAVAENKISNLGGDEPISDRVSIQIGTQLYNDHGVKIDSILLVRKLYEHKYLLHQYDGSRPQEQRVFTNSDSAP